MSVRPLGVHMRALQDALCAIAPIAEGVGVAWREGESYDEWDDIADALYQAFVLTAVAADPNSRDAFPLPRYAHTHSSYGERSLIRVDSRAVNDLVFFAFGTLTKPFDAIEAFRLSGTDDPLILIPAAEATFRIEFRYAGGKQPVVIDSIGT